MCSAANKSNNESNQQKESVSDHASSAPVVNLDAEEENKTLGVLWNPKNGVIGFAPREVKVESFTKRSVLSNISKLYYPLGLASAVTIKARIALQNIWKAKHLDWADPLPHEISETWKQLFNEIESLKNTKFPRCLKPSNASGSSKLHVFADASKAACSAVAYLVWETLQGPHVSLVSAKARVAPVRQTTIPRLQFMAAVVASWLAKTIFDEFKTKPSSVTFLSDSTIALNWL